MADILGFRGEYNWLSNFYEAPVTMPDGITYRSRESAYQAQKTRNMEDRIKMSTLSPIDAKKFGRRVKLRSDWDRDLVMYAVLYYFFAQNKEFFDKLRATGDSYLEETNSWGDTYWGVCDGLGENRLGESLMVIRGMRGTHSSWEKQN